MPLDASAFEQVKLTLGRVASDAIKLSSKEVMKIGYEIQDLAKRMAPIDYGNLEQAIKIRGIGSLRDAGGRFTKGGGSFEIYVDNNMVAEQPDSERKNQPVYVGDYAWWVHENVQPYGQANLGPKSEEKQATDPSVQVGGGFMDRAAEQGARNIDAKIGALIAKRLQALDFSEEM